MAKDCLVVVKGFFWKERNVDMLKKISLIIIAFLVISMTVSIVPSFAQEFDHNEPFRLNEWIDFGSEGCYIVSDLKGYIENDKSEDYVMKLTGVLQFSAGDLIRADYGGWSGTYRALVIDPVGITIVVGEIDNNGDKIPIGFRAIDGNGTSDRPYILESICNEKVFGISVRVNAKDIDFDQPPIIVDGRTLVPLRAIFEAMGATVDWDQDTQTVVSELDGIKISLQIGSNVLYRNGEPVELDVPAQVVNNRTLVPARAIAEAYDAYVGWDGVLKTVEIAR